MLRCSNCRGGGLSLILGGALHGAKPSVPCPVCEGAGELARYEVYEVFRSTCEPNVVSRHDMLIEAFEAKGARIARRAAEGRAHTARQGYVCGVWDGDDGERGDLDEYRDVACAKCGWTREEHSEEECADAEWVDAHLVSREQRILDDAANIDWSDIDEASREAYRKTTRQRRNDGPSNMDRRA